MKKLTALLLALIMVLAMNATAFAAGFTNGIATSREESITIPKGVTVTNSVDGITVYGPVIDYTYSIAPQNPNGATVTNGTASVTINTGVTNGVSFDASDETVDTVTVSFDNDAAAIASGEKEISKDITVYVHVDEFEHAGIYRYVLTDTTAATDLAAAGIVRNDDYDETRYLDVYLINDDSSTHTNKLSVAGYVLVTTNESTNASTNKNGGYDQDYDTLDAGSTSTDPKYDQYPTYNVEIKKVVTGTAGDKTYNFPFTINGTDFNTNHDFKQGSAIDAATDYTSAISTTLHDGQSYFLVGLGSGSSMSAVETNTSPDKYTLSTTGDGAISNLGLDAGTGTGTDGFVGFTENKTLTFTNNLDAISQTGVVLRFAPYALMLGAGVVLFIILKSRKNKAVEEA